MRALGELRSASEKPPAVPDRGWLRAVLAGTPGLLQSICNICMQDFICSDSATREPEGCELLPARAAAPPPTHGITPEDVFGAR